MNFCLDFYPKCEKFIAPHDKYIRVMFGLGRTGRENFNNDQNKYLTKFVSKNPKKSVLKYMHKCIYIRIQR